MLHVKTIKSVQEFDQVATGADVRAARKAAKLTQFAVAQYLGMKPSQYSLLEAGERYKWNERLYDEVMEAIEILKPRNPEDHKSVKVKAATK